MKKSPTEPEMHRARLSRDSSYDGIFWVGVRTMKVFCRPSCPAKQPLDKNVIHFTSIEEAEAAGFRPCKRCRPISGSSESAKQRIAPRTVNAAGSISTRSLESPLGQLIMGATEKGLCLLEFADCRSLPTEIATLEQLFGCLVAEGDNRYLDQIAAELEQYFRGDLTRFSTPLEVVGTPFERAVWDQLLEIPYGETISYSGLADKVGNPGAQRAVGRANGSNKIAIVIPCHRVVQANGGLAGYGGGLWRKQYLLDLEGKHTSEQPDES